MLDALARIGGIELTDDIIVHGALRPFGSRARVELHGDRETGTIGFYERRSRRIVPIDHCMVSRDEIDTALGAIRRSRQPLPAEIHLLGGHGQIRSAPAFPPIAGGPFWLPVAGMDYLVDPGSFFQSSLDLLPELIGAVTASLPRSGSALTWDLFCGAGLFSLPLAKSSSKVVGVDFDARTIANASKSAERNGIRNATFAASDVYRWLTGKKRADVRPNLIVVDPPRAGLDRRLSELLSRRDVERLTYVSCDPTTLARDLRMLTSGALRLVDVAIFDLFPQTHHVETVVRLASA